MTAGICQKEPATGVIACLAQAGALTRQQHTEGMLHENAQLAWRSQLVVHSQRLKNSRNVLADSLLDVDGVPAAAAQHPMKARYQTSALAVLHA